MKIATFIEWFISKFIEIATFMIGKLGQINIYANVSLLDFIITIAIISAFISIVITAPNLGIVKREIRGARKEKNK